MLHPRDEGPAVAPDTGVRRMFTESYYVCPKCGNNSRFGQSKLPEAWFAGAAGMVLCADCKVEGCERLNRPEVVTCEVCGRVCIGHEQTTVKRAWYRNGKPEPAEVHYRGDTPIRGEATVRPSLESSKTAGTPELTSIGDTPIRGEATVRPFYR